MKQMSPIEMDGFLKGRYIPSDLKVNETNAEYLVRKFGKLEPKLETALRECSSAGIVTGNLEAKYTKIAAGNTSLKQSEKKFNDFCRERFGGRGDDATETPATDAFLAEVQAQGMDAAIETAKNLVAQEYEYKDFKATQSGCCAHPGSDLVGKIGMTEQLVDFTTQLHKGDNQ